MGVSFLFSQHGLERRTMDYNVFTNVILASLQEKLPECTVALKNVVKNNNVTLSAVCIKSEDVNAAPTIYLEQFYEAYLDGESIEYITQEIIEIYERNKPEIDYDFAEIEEYENARNHLYFKAVNYESNDEFLSDVPYFRFEDLALVPYFHIKDGFFGDASVVIHYDLFDKWKVERDTFYKNIMDNMENRFDYDFVPITDMLSRISGISLTEDCTDIGMYVLCSERQLYGAALISVCSVLGKIAEAIESDYFIIPSSVHELIIVRSDEAQDEDMLNDMVCEVNNTVVCAEDYLSDHVYFYKRGIGITH